MAAFAELRLGAFEPHAGVIPLTRRNLEPRQVVQAGTAGREATKVGKHAEQGRSFALEKNSRGAGTRAGCAKCALERQAMWMPRLP